MKQALEKRLASFVCEAQFRQEVERIPLLRGTPSVPPANPRDTSSSVRFGGRLRIVFIVVGVSEPSIEDLIPHRKQRPIGPRVSKVGEAREDPMSSLPFRVRIMDSSEEPVGTAARKQSENPR